MCSIFEAQTATSYSDLSVIRAPTAAELSGNSTAAIRLLFSDRRLAEITRPRTSADNVKAAAALKAQRTERSRIGITPTGLGELLRPGPSPLA